MTLTLVTKSGEREGGPRELCIEMFKRAIKHCWDTDAECNMNKATVEPTNMWVCDCMMKAALAIYYSLITVVFIPYSHHKSVHLSLFLIKLPSFFSYSNSK